MNWARNGLVLGLCIFVGGGLAPVAGPAEEPEDPPTEKGAAGGQSMPPRLQAWIDEAKAAWEKSPQDAVKLAEYGRRLVVAGQEGEGLALLTKAVGLAPQNPEVLLSQAKSLSKASSWLAAEESALKAARSPLATKKIAAEARVLAATMKIRSNDLKGAEALLKEATELDPKNGGAHLNLGMLYYDAQRRDEALFELELASQLNLNNARFQSTLAKLYEAMGLGPRAKEIWRRVVALSPGDGDSRFILANYCMQAGQWAESASLLREAVAINPADGNAQLALGVSLLQLGDLEGAEKQAEKAEKLGVPVVNLRDGIYFARQNKK